MTREEARQIIATWLASSKGEKGQCGYIEGWFYEKDVEAFRMAIKALEQEPCEDCVPRKWLEKNAKEFGGYYEDTVYAVPLSILDNAPSVVPKRGKWIVYPLMDEGRVELECPICGDTFIRAVDSKPHFCENCGARMESGEE